METLTLTQKYVLCAIGERGGLDVEKQTCLVAAGVLELWLENVITLEGKTFSVCGPLPEGLSHLRSLYEEIEKKQPVKVEKLMEEYAYGISGRKLQRLMEDVGESLVRAGGAEKRSGGLLGKKTIYCPDPERRDAAVQMIRAELLEEGPLSDDAAALAVLLEKSGALKRYFSAYERKRLNQRLKELKDSPEHQVVTRMMEHLYVLFSLITVSVLSN